ncbi:kunitz trypsin inhibitor 2-like [Neltuma alba]|uniref:kunitz trypsin inhibitor 2-like n=1 Tax=Neltuma alba TaxID=207710 RepID=UPI0010A4CF78|nr:kunitz trypsin inhibitor 2-like [Prosopis alba]
MERQYLNVNRFVLWAKSSNPVILPATGGSFTLAGYQNDTCPLVVVHAQSQKADSLKFPPVTFLPADPSAHVVQTSTNVNVKFSTTSSKPCGSSMVWRLLKRITEARFISTDGVEGNPNVNTFVNWFKIEKLSSDGKSGGAYKLRFCPTEVCKCSVTCSDLGIFVADDKKRYLGLADKVEPISVVFKRAS